MHLNDEEDQMLAHCSKVSGKPKSQIFRNALSDYYINVRLNELKRQSEFDAIELDAIRMKRVIECPYCCVLDAVDLADCSTGDSTTERQIGPEQQHWFDFDNAKCVACGCSFRVTGCITEYLLGSHDSEMINITGVLIE